MSIVFTPISLYLCIELIRPCEPSKHVYLFFGPLGDLSITSFLQEPYQSTGSTTEKELGQKLLICTRSHMKVSMNSFLHLSSCFWELLRY